MYIPSKLPFFKLQAEAAESDAAALSTQVKKDEGVIKLKKVVSHVSGELERKFNSGVDPDVDTELRDMLFDSKTGQPSLSEHEPLLLQLPGTLPFAEVKPHAATALEEMIERLRELQQTDQVSMDSSLNLKD